MYFYRAVGRDGKALDFMLSEKRNTAAATPFFTKALAGNGIPLRIVIAKRGLAMVFQSYPLYPHLSVRENVGFGLKTLPSPARITGKADFWPGAKIGLAFDAEKMH